VKKISPWLFTLLTAIGTVYAETVYVTDNLNLSIRSEANAQAPIVKSIPSGTPLTVIGEKTRSGFIYVRTENGIEGYIQSSHTKKEPPARDQFEIANKTIKALQAENLSLKTELKIVKESITPGTSLEQALANERDQLSLELNELKSSAAGVVQLKNERDEYQERVVNAERELQQIKLENQALKDSTEQDWFLYGGILSFFSVILGFILPKLSWRRKGRWDSY